MAKLLGNFMNELAVEGSTVDWKNIKTRLEMLKQKFSFSKDNPKYDNLTGLVGTKVIYEYWRTEIPKSNDVDIKFEELFEN